MKFAVDEDGKPNHTRGPIDRLLCGLSISQLVGGFALLVAIWHTYGPGSEISPLDPHAHLARDMMLANMYSGVACHLVLTALPFRNFVHWLFFLAFTITVILAEAMTDHHKPTKHTVLILTSLALIATCGFWVFWLPKPWRAWSGSIVLLFTFAAAMYFVVRVGQLKFDGVENEGCDLNSPAENQKSFGQVLAIVLISIQIPLSFVDVLDV